MNGASDLSECEVQQAPIQTCNDLHGAETCSDENVQDVRYAHAYERTRGYHRMQQAWSHAGAAAAAITHDALLVHNGRECY